MKRKNKTACILYVLFAVVYMAGHVVHISPVVMNLSIAIVGICSLGYCVKKHGFGGMNSRLIIGGILLSFLMIISMIYNGNSDVLDLLWIWTYMGIAALMYEFPISQGVYWRVAYATIAFILFYAVGGGRAGDLLVSVSENNISAYVIFFVLAGYLAQRQDRKAIQYLPAFLVLAICLWTGSRGGSLAALVLIGSIFVYNFLAIRKGKLRTLLKIGALLLAAGWILEMFAGAYIDAILQKLERYGGESVRTTMWLEYLDGSVNSVGNLLFGANTMDVEYKWLSFYGGNTHNAFLTLHAKFGLLAFMAFFAICWKAFRKAQKQKCGMIYIVMVTAGTRMLFDWIAFPGLYDALVWYMILYALDKRDWRVKQEVAPKYSVKMK